MDAGLTLKSVANLAQMSDPRPDAAARAAVATELAPAQAVTAANSASNTQATDDSRLREIILDPHSREVIYRAVDALSRRLIRRWPEEAKLRLRAYARYEREKKDRGGGFETTV